MMNTFSKLSFSIEKKTTHLEFKSHFFLNVTKKFKKSQLYHEKKVILKNEKFIKKTVNNFKTFKKKAPT